MSHFDKLLEAGHIQPPRFLKNNIIYEVITGSIAYGTNIDNVSDFDMYGVCIPLKEMIFPHLAGEILGFGRQIQRFEQYIQHHVSSGNKSYDLTYMSIVKYFQLCMENNPNMVDTLFVPENCVTHMNAIGSMIRENRRHFLHKGSYYKFSGYAHSQLHKMSSNKREGKRKEIHDEFGFDVKFAMHLVRLSYEAEMILSEHNLDLQRHSEHLKAIRRGEIKEEDIRLWFSAKEKYLEELFAKSTLRDTPDYDFLKELLLNCLEHHFGNLDKAIVREDKYRVASLQISEILRSVGL
ncbi:MAG: nucleotidyltransferase domain-containing protein [Patescibacteria group bacterium]|nr:nucleotidyltransferase domain-containing protein [Patescibacteria group bacterium]MDE2438810.1 nucleotidyltransferase domain-containing protein [Patescibacteria group bacterium]